MLFVIGLGNPERRYAGTRHNIGFEVVERIAERCRFSFRPGRGEYLIARGSLEDSDLVLVKPVTYMNESGMAVRDLRDHFDAPPESMLVVCDDFQLPLGQLRLRLKGSDGGHNGLASVIYHLQSDEFPRLRCGIGSQEMPVDKQLMADFVLEKFSPVERPLVDQMEDIAADACLLALRSGMPAAMNVYNKKQPNGEQSPEQ